MQLYSPKVYYPGYDISLEWKNIVIKWINNSTHFPIPQDRRHPHGPTGVIGYFQNCTLNSSVIISFSVTWLKALSPNSLIRIFLPFVHCKTLHSLSFSLTLGLLIAHCNFFLSFHAQKERTCFSHPHSNLELKSKSYWRC